VAHVEKLARIKRLKLS